MHSAEMTMGMAEEGRRHLDLEIDRYRASERETRRAGADLGSQADATATSAKRGPDTAAAQSTIAHFAARSLGQHGDPTDHVDACRRGKWCSAAAELGPDLLARVTDLLAKAAALRKNLARTGT